jgi:tRNA pseudouridine38-40 synthase
MLLIDEAPDGFHAIRDAIEKTYRYQIQFGPHPSVLMRRHHWYVRGRLDVPAMRAGAAALIGEHDFASFQAVGAERKSSVRTVTQIQLFERECDGYPQLWIEISANGFLYNMVRNIVGSLVLVGRHRKPPSWLTSVLAAQDRRAAGPTAPARGLILLQVRYHF